MKKGIGSECELVVHCKKGMDVCGLNDWRNLVCVERSLSFH